MTGFVFIAIVDFEQHLRPAKITYKNCQMLPSPGLRVACTDWGRQNADNVIYVKKILMSLADVHPELSWQQKLLVLTAAFLGWMFAGLRIALFVLIHRPAMISLMTDGAAAGASAVNEQEVT
jgi:hypothetical protein